MGLFPDWMSQISGPSPQQQMNQYNSTVSDLISRGGGGAYTPAQGGIAYAPSPQVQGAAIDNRNQSSGGGGGGDSLLQQLAKADRNPSQESEYQRLLQEQQNTQGAFADQQRSSINQGWDDYTKQLNDMLNIGVPGQRQAQEQIAQSSYNQGINTLGEQKKSSEAAVQQQQKSSLKDLGENMRNLFQSANIYLGSRGAADSSAADQYSYALQKLGTKSRGDILSQVNQRMTQIGDIFNQESGRLKTDYDTKLAGIAQWFNEAQNQLRGQIGQAGLNKQKDIQNLSAQLYNQAVSALQQLQAEASGRRQSLEAWAMNNSKSVQELARNMQAAQQMPGYQGLFNGMPQVNTGSSGFVPTGYGATNEERQRGLFG